MLENPADSSFQKDDVETGSPPGGYCILTGVAAGPLLLEYGYWLQTSKQQKFTDWHL